MSFVFKIRASVFINPDKPCYVMDTESIKGNGKISFPCQAHLFVKGKKHHVTLIGMAPMFTSDNHDRTLWTLRMEKPSFAMHEVLPGTDITVS